MSHPQFLPIRPEHTDNQVTEIFLLISTSISHCYFIQFFFETSTDLKGLKLKGFIFISLPKNSFRPNKSEDEQIILEWRN